MSLLITASLLLVLSGTSLIGTRERTLLQTEVPAEIRSGRTFVPLRAAATALGATVTWKQASRTVVLTQGNRSVRLSMGKRVVLVDGRPRRLEAPPYAQQGRMMIPLRFAGEALAVSVRYEGRVHSVLVGPEPSGTLWVLPLPTARPGIVVLMPKAGAMVTSPVRVHGQANVFEGNVVAEVRDAQNKVLARGVGTGAMGSYGPFTVVLTYTAPVAGRQQGRIFVYAPSAREEGEIAFATSIPVTLR